MYCTCYLCILITHAVSVLRHHLFVSHDLSVCSCAVFAMHHGASVLLMSQKRFK